MMNDDFPPGQSTAHPPARPRRRIRWPRLGAAALVLLLLGGAGFVLASHLPATLAAAGQSTPSRTNGLDGHDGGRGHGGPGHELTVSSVTGATVVAKDEDGAV